MKTFYYRKELNKGYIPSDKVTVSGEPFEAFWGDEKLAEMRKSIVSMYAENFGCKSMLHDIDTVLTSYLERSDWEVDDKSVKPFYVNINRDGIDLFQHRWNWKRK